MQRVAAILAICHVCAWGEQDGRKSTTSTPSLRPTKVDDAARTCEDEFGSFVRKFKKHYDSPEEEEMRMNIFCDRLAWIKKRNGENHKYTVGITPFADLSPDEFRSTYGISAKYRNANISEIWGGLEEVNDPSFFRSTAAPSSVDWRKEGAVSAVQDQGKCGSCWTFATTGALEGAWKLAGGSLYVLSSQQLLDCADENYGNLGCDGGNEKRGYEYITDEGLCQAQDYSYKAVQSECQASNCTQVIPPGGVLRAISVEQDENGLMQAVAQQPVAVNIDGESLVFQLYTGGIISGACGTKIDHAVLIVGYGTDQGTPYWIIKNSWGTQWGEDGFGRIQRGVNGTGECGIRSQAVYPVVTTSPTPPSPPPQPTPPSPTSPPVTPGTWDPHTTSIVAISLAVLMSCCAVGFCVQAVRKHRAGREPLLGSSPPIVQATPVATAPARPTRRITADGRLVEDQAGR
ncbi:CEP2 [Symbiodinium sp. CCMP2592]|nr:CEP2 [Symbiodinium sp. CCMP2592]